MRYGLALFLMLVVVVSGCNGIIRGSNEGIRVNGFGFDELSITDKDTVELSLDIENVGSYNTEEVIFFLYGFDTDSWESKYVGASVGDAAEDSWEIDNFMGYDTGSDFQGMSAEYYQTFKPIEEKIMRGMTNTYTFNGRLCYEYETQATAKINAISAAEKRENGVGSSGTIEVVNSYGPVQVEVRTKAPLVFYDGDSGVETELALIVRDVGVGYPVAGSCSIDVAAENVNYVDDIIVTFDGEELSIDDAGALGDNGYPLFNGEGVFYYEYSAPDPRPKATYTLNVVVKYHYYVDKKTSITVSGTSEEVTVGGGPSSGGSGVDTRNNVIKLGYCENICREYQEDRYEDYVGMAMCTEGDGEDIGIYPNTGTKVMLDVLYDGEEIVGTNSFYLEDQNLHDVTVEDADILGISVGELNVPDYSRQFDYTDLKVDSDGDGLPDEWESLFNRIDKDERDTNGDGRSDGAEECYENVCAENDDYDEGDCVEGQTYRWNYDNGCRRDAYLEELTLELSGSSDEFMVTTTANSVPHEIDEDETVDGMRIVGIGDKTIAEMTAESRNSKIQKITYIDVEKIDLRSVASPQFDDVVKKIECKVGSTTYTEDTVCKCVVDAEAKYAPLEGTSSTRCNNKCESVGLEGGICYDEDRFDNTRDATRCSGSRLVQYDIIAPASEDNYGCGDDYCWCYELLQTLTSAERSAMCE